MSCRWPRWCAARSTGGDNKIVTADALHTAKATANHIHTHGGEFVLLVKENRQALSDVLDALL